MASVSTRFLGQPRLMTPTLFIGTKSDSRFVSGINPVEHAWEGNCFADMFQFAYPGNDPFDSHSKSAVWNAAVTAHIEIPFKGFPGQIMLLQTLKQQIVIMNALAPADDLAVTFGREHIDAQCKLLVLWIRLHVESFCGCRIAMHHHWTIVIFGEHCLIRSTEIASV